MKIRQRIVYRNGEYLCYCSYEDQYLPCSHFHQTKKDHGYAYSCKKCTIIQKNARPEDRNENPEDLLKAKELLKKIGYNPESETSVYGQFISKHHL